MKLEHLIAFSEVARQHSFSKAADSLFISQSSLSRKIAELERELNCELFRRSTRSVQLTQAGCIFNIRATRIIREWTALCDEMSCFKENINGSIRIGYLVSSIFPFITKSLNSPLWPEDISEITFYKGYPSDTLQMLREGHLNCAFMHRPSIGDCNDLKLTPIIPATVHVWVHRSHPLSSEKSLSLRRLSRETGVRCRYSRDPGFFSGFDQGFLNAGLKPLRYIETGESSEIPVLARQHKAVCLAVSLYQPWDGFVSIPIEDWTVDYTLFLVCNPHENNPLVNHLADCIRRTITLPSD